ncbi:MAG: DUF4142 domain-containing protein [Armatimonadetes bacterium]|nr:DUF4142 domain-containing protein [Armatimonadota bacterium]
MFGQHMVQDHSKANEEWKQLTAEKRVQLPKSLSPKHNRLSKLSEAAFGRAYMQIQVKDHRKAVKMFSYQANRGSGDLSRWAGQTLPTFKQHLQESEGIFAGLRSSQTTSRRTGGTDNAGHAQHMNQSGSDNR